MESNSSVDQAVIKLASVPVEDTLNVVDNTENADHSRLTEEIDTVDNDGTISKVISANKNCSENKDTSNEPSVNKDCSEGKNISNESSVKKDCSENKDTSSEPCSVRETDNSDFDEKAASVDIKRIIVVEEANSGDEVSPLKKKKLEKDVVEEVSVAYIEKKPKVPEEQSESVPTTLVDVVCVQKAEASKRSKESKESRDFRCLILSSDNFKGWRLQEGPCAEAYYSPCLICSLNKNRKDKSDCRFYNRMLYCLKALSLLVLMNRSVENPKECRRLTIADARFFVDESKASTSAAINTKDFWRTSTIGKRRVTRLSKPAQHHKLGKNDSHFAAYILQCVKGEYEKIVERENRILRLDCSGIPQSVIYGNLLNIDQSINPTDGVFFSHSCNCEQICDACECSIFNAHYCCVICGAELCWLCYEELVTSSSGDDSPEWLKLLKCLNGVEHVASMFHLGSFLPVPDLYKKTLKKVYEQFIRYRIHSNGSICNGNHGRRYFQEDKCYCPRLCNNIKVQDDRLLEPEAIATFKTHLSLHIPIIVEGVNEHPDFYPAVWSREAFEKVVSSQKKLHVLDCQTLRQAYLDGKVCSVTQFWKHFDSVHVEDEPYLKMKDFPETAMFEKVAPQQYANYFTILPFLDYTQVNLKDHERGKLNLLNVFEEQENLSDPGPKVFIGVVFLRNYFLIFLGLCNAPDLASTPLHMNLSDSVNFLAVVQSPKELSRGELSKVIGERLSLEGIPAEEKALLLKRPDKVGAIWKVFHPSDIDRLREAIIEWKGNNGERVGDDFIYNHDVFVTVELMNFLKEKGKYVNASGIYCYVFVQCEGDVVFVPSGCPHQVQNINSCIQVGEYFVAVEGVKHVMKLSNDFRRLKKSNDLIRIDTILHRACSAAVETLSSSEPCLVSSSV
uniref:JmjC domain-containing protein n=1 Tax=Syphacia muris TaxID=451379 RepID=A0A0N5AKV0_9BILA